MKKTTKILSIALALVCLVLCFANSVPAAKAATGDYKAIRLKSDNFLYANHYYTNAELTGEPIENCIVKIQSLYPLAGCDNNNNSELCSYPYKFNHLYDEYVKRGSTGDVVIPCCTLDLALGGEPMEIAAFSLTLRKYFDCQPLHVKIQVATDAAATNWKTVCDQDNIVWDSLTTRWTFDPIEAYQIRLLALDLSEVGAEGDGFSTILGDETRFCFAEVDVFTLEEGGSSGSSSGGSSSGSTGGSTTTTRPVIQFPTSGGSQGATQAPTQAPTKAPTQPATQAPTSGGSQSATKAPTQPATQAPTQIATQAPTGDVTTTEPTGTVDPSAPTVDPSAPTVDPSAPTVDPSAPTDEPTVAPTEGEPTAEPTTQTTEPEETTPTTDDGGEQKPDNTWIIIVAIVAAAAVAGGAVFFIIKKKKQG